MGHHICFGRNMGEQISDSVYARQPLHLLGHSSSSASGLEVTFLCCGAEGGNKGHVGEPHRTVQCEALKSRGGDTETAV